MKSNTNGFGYRIGYDCGSASSKTATVFIEIGLLRPFLDGNAFDL